MSGEECSTSLCSSLSFVPMWPWLARRRTCSASARCRRRLLDLLPAFEVGQHAGLPLYFEQGRPANAFGDLASFVEPLPQIDHRPICGAVEAFVKERLRRI